MNMPQQPSVFYLGSYLKTPTDSILLTLCVEKDDYDNVKTITAAPEDPAKSLDVWQYCLTSAEALRLGTFLGTKYKSPSSSGVFQTIDDTLNHIAQHGTAETLACTIFGVVPQAAYAVFQLDNGTFSARLMNSYLKLDYPAMRRWLGGDHAARAPVVACDVIAAVAAGGQAQAEQNRKQHRKEMMGSFHLLFSLLHVSKRLTQDARSSHFHRPTR